MSYYFAIVAFHNLLQSNCICFSSLRKSQQFHHQEMVPEIDLTVIHSEIFRDYSKC